MLWLHASGGARRRTSSQSILKRENMHLPTLTVVTATKNCAGLIGTLIESLRHQTDGNFTWLVVDGRSTDTTLDVIAQSGLASVCVSSELDFSIYDALNRAALLCSTDYYMVLGADDVIRPDCIANYRKIASETNADLVLAAVETFGTIRLPMRGKRWLRGGNAICASHSVGTLIRRDLHERFGHYSNRYVNAADMHFVLKVASAPDTRVVPGPFVAGSFSNDGISSVDEMASLADFFRLQLAFGEGRFRQLMLYALRVTRACWRLPRSNLR
jgi:glycosyltransferase involved in cell wall biosynthesis